MKRTGEFVLGIIGVILSALMAILGVIFLFIQGNEQVKMEMEKAMETDPSVNPGDLTMVMDVFGTIGWFLTIASILGLVLGLIAIFVLKAKKPKKAGIWFIVAAVLMGLVSVGAGFLPALLYLIAGIMCLARKQKTDDAIVI
jgi:cytochrome bd-type quinol oxidase subunit 2